MTEEQAVADVADESGQPTTEAGGAQDDLEAALSEFDNASTETNTEQKPVSREQITEVVSFVQEERNRRVQEETNRDIAKAVGEIKGDLEIDEEIAEGFIHARATKDARILQAFQNRRQNPTGWAKVVGGLKGEFAKKFDALPDRSATEDRAAVADAVRRASTKPSDPDPVDPRKLNQMSDYEFARYKQGLGA